ncbi:MAG: NAD(P)/FAD-dependent oxidoreductase [Cyclobacteriaceae bacterium]
MAELPNYDTIIIGGGQSALALGYYLRRTDLNYLILDGEEKPGGSWQNYWDSVSLFSPAQWSSLPGTLMPGGVDHYPGKEDVLQYFERYEKKYNLAVQRPVWVESVEKDGEYFSVNTSKGVFQTKTVIGATGSFRNPTIPGIDGLDEFRGEVIHSAAYLSPESFKGKRVGIIGEGNSGAQILAELSKFTETYWITKSAPDYLPDHVDGKYLFDAASQLFEAKKKGRDYIPPSLGDIVMVPSVKEARERNALSARQGLVKFSATSAHFENGESIALDALIFCTGYKSELRFLEKLPVSIKHHKIRTDGTKSKEVPGLWMVGYGSWTGFASATVIGVGRSAKQTIAEIKEYLS